MRTTESGLKLNALKKTLGKAWLEIDPRALGLFRIAFVLLCIGDVLRRFKYIDVFYSNDGVLSNHFSLFAPTFRSHISLLSGFSSTAEVTLFFIISIFILAMYTIGYKTRLFKILSWLVIISIHGRNPLLTNGGDVVMTIWWLWTIWLPQGQRFSIDALLVSLREGADRRPDLLDKRPQPSLIPIRSFALLMVLWQLAIIYFFNAVHKSGATWMDGTAIGYCLEQDRIVTPLGLWVKAHLPLAFTQMLTWGTLVIEGAAPILLLSPYGTKWCRRIIIIGLVGLHGGIILLTNVGFFSPVMMVSYILLLGRADIDLLERTLRKIQGQKLKVWFDDECGVCFRFARISARLDRLNLIQWYGSTLSEERPSGMPTDEYERLRGLTIIVESDDGQKRWLAHQGIGRIICALPCGWLVGWVFLTPGLHLVFKPFYYAFAERRHKISALMGFGQCGITPIQIDGPAQGTLSAPPSRLATSLMNLYFGFFLVATTSQMLHENRYMHKKVLKETLGIDYKQPKFLANTVQYFRIFQGWSMFAPDAPRNDGWLVIDVEKSDGTHVDPQTNQAPNFTTAHSSNVSWDQFWGSYSTRIAKGRKKRYRKEFLQWIRNSRIDRLHLKAGERVKSVKIWWVSDRSPKPKSGNEPKPNPKKLIAEYPTK